LRNEASDLPAEIPARRGSSVVYKGKTLLSRVDPVAQGERLAAKIPIKERTLYFCPSPLYGYGLSMLLERFRKEDGKYSAVLCLEADEKLFQISHKALAALTDSTPEARDGQRLLALAKVSGPEHICAFVRRTWGERVFRRVEAVRLTGGWQLFPGLYDEALGALRRELALEWGNAMTLIRLGRLYARNLIRNLAFLPEAENSLNFGSAPVLALGAGPSLDSFLDELSSFSGGKIPGERPYKIICVDTCLPALHERGVLPDLAVILESQHWNLRDFSGARGRKIDAALDLSALPASARVLEGKRFFFATPWTGLRLWGRLEEAGFLPETFSPLGSVGLSAVALALRLGSGPVLCSGIDFSFTLDSYHARSTPGQAERARRQNRFRSLINPAAAFRDGTFSALSKTGETVRSDPALRNYRNLFEQEFGGNPRLLDIAGSGLPLGARTVSPVEAFAVLSGKVSAGREEPAGRGNPPREKIAAFARGEAETLRSLREILTGEKTADLGRLEELLDTADYLWAHFPDCAATGGRRPPGTDTGFLRRVRTEIEPFLKLWEMTLGELQRRTILPGSPPIKAVLIE
jgi:hypothetical protein